MASYMTDDIARWIILSGFMVLAPVGVYHRLHAHTGEPLDRSQEGWLILALLRPLGILFMCGIIAFMWYPPSMEWSRIALPGAVRWWGIGVGCVGGVLLIWTFRALGHNLTDTVVTRQQATLVTRGPYAWVRHPFYLSFALLVVANSIVASNWYLLLTGMGCFGLMMVRTRREESKLVERFGAEYTQYARVTGRFLPGIMSPAEASAKTPSPSDSAARWGWPELAVFLFTLMYLIPFANICLRGGNREFLLYLGVMVVLIPTVAWLHARIRLHLGTIWGLSLWGLAHLAGGLMAVPPAWSRGQASVLYDVWLVPGFVRYDQLVHAAGFGITTWLCWQGLRASVVHARGGTLYPTFGLLFLCALSGMGLGALNEVVEFIAVLTVPNTNVGGYVNTGWDLVFNAMGTTVAALAIAACDRPEHRTD